MVGSRHVKGNVRSHDERREGAHLLCRLSTAKARREEEESGGEMRSWGDEDRWYLGGPYIHMHPMCVVDAINGFGTETDAKQRQIPGSPT
jgi:hypothetical protein